MKKSRRILSILLSALLVLGVFSPMASAVTDSAIARDKIIVDDAKNSTGDAESPQKAFDGDYDTKWCDNKTKDVSWIAFSTTEKVSLTNIKVYHAGGHGQDKKVNNTKAFSLQVPKDMNAFPVNPTKEFYNDDNNWVDIVTVDNSVQNSITDTNIINAPESNHYRLNVTDGDGAANQWVAVRIQEIELRGRAALVNPKTITFNGNGASGTMPELRVEQGDEYALPQNGFNVPDDKCFDGWSVNDGPLQKPDETITVQDNIVLKAIWKQAVIHTVTFENNGGSGTMSSQNIKEGTEYTLPQCTFNPPSGKVFVNWEIGGTAYKPNDKIIVNSDIIVKAIWQVNEKAITIHFKQGEGMTESFSQPLEDKTIATTLPKCPFTPPEGKVFKCWRDENGRELKPGSVVSYEDIIAKEFTWTAQYEDAYYDNANIAIQSGEPVPGKEFGVHYSSEGAYNKVVNGRINADDVYISTNKINQSGGDSIIFSASTSFAASAFQIFSLDSKTVPGKYSLSILRNEGEYINTPSSAKQKYLIDADNWRDLAVVENINYENEKITYLEKQIKAKYYKFTMYDDHRGRDNNVSLSEVLLYVGHDKVNASTISFKAENGFGTMRDIVVEKGSSFKLGNCQFAPKDGYEFSSWVVNGAEYKIGDTITISGDTLVTAKFIKINHSTISFSTEVGSLNLLKIKTGTSKPLPMCPGAPAGKTFVGWSINSKTYGEGEMYKGNGDVTATALYEALQQKTASAGDTAWSDGVYEITGTLTIPERVNISGNVVLKLADGAVLNTPKGIGVPNGAVLTIEGNGTLNANAVGGAAIGGNQGATTGKIIINGGIININAEGQAELDNAGIGSGKNASNTAKVIINDGVITAKSKIGSPIGGGNNSYATCDVTINGGKITATSTGNAAAIGAGLNNTSGLVTINGGDITANASDGAGIGGSMRGKADVVINGGKINAKAKYGAGIGGGSYGYQCNVTINGGKITATPYMSTPGIGVGSNSNEKATLTVTGGVIESMAGPHDSVTIGTGAGMPLEFLPSTSSGGVIITNKFVEATMGRHKMNIIYSLDGKKFNLYGTPVLKSNFTIPADGIVYVNEGETLVIPKGVTVSGIGKIINKGTVICTGTLLATIEGNQPLSGKDLVTLSFDANGGTGTMESVKKEEGQTYTLPKPSFTPPKDKRLDYWLIDGLRYHIGDTVTLTKNATAIAYWKNITYVNVSLAEGSGTAPYRPENIRHDSEELFVFPNCLFKAPETSVFSGWKIAGDQKLYKADELKSIKNDVTLTAQWKELSPKAFEGLALENGIYTVDGNIVKEEPLEIVGDVILHLNKGATLTAKQGIIVPYGSSLTIEGEGNIVAYPKKSINQDVAGDAAIGGRANEKSGIVIINGGNVDVKVSETTGYNNEFVAGIGGGTNGQNNLVIINGGNVKAESFHGAAIGTSANSEGQNAAGTVLITGGKVNAKSVKGSAIGGGAIIKEEFASPTGNIIICDGQVTAESSENIAIGSNSGNGVKFSTGKNGNAFIVSKSPTGNSIEVSNKEFWKGIISVDGGNNFYVYGNQVIKEDIILQTTKKDILFFVENNTLTINKGVSFVGPYKLAFKDSGKIINNGVLNINGFNSSLNYSLEKISGNGKFFMNYQKEIPASKYFSEKVNALDGKAYTGQVLATADDINLNTIQFNVNWNIKNTAPTINRNGVQVNNVKTVGEYSFVFSDIPDSVFKVTIVKATVVPSLVVNIHDEVNGTFAPEGEIKLPDTNGAYTYSYEGVEGTNYPKSDVVPTLPGKYKVYINYIGDNCDGTNEDNLYIRKIAKYTKPKTLTALKGQKLSDIIIPIGKNNGKFTWNNPNEKVKPGLNTYLATYTDNNDKTYYPDVNVELQIDVKEFVMVSFSSGLGEGSMTTMVVEKGKSITLPESNFVAPKLQKFLKWDSGNVGQKVVVNKNMVITAQYTDGFEVLGEGTCSNDTNVKWVLTTDGRLNIWGIGKMLDFSKVSAPWARYSERIHSVNVSEGVTSISEKAFINAVNLRYIRIANTVTEISSNAFYDLSKVTVITEEGFNNPNLAGAKISRMGDINADTAIDNTDYSMAVNEALSLEGNLKDSGFELADTNNDGIIDILDLIYIEREVENNDGLPIF